ncbi:D-amino-acid transaminase [Laceyella putida]|uniref:D-alanine aminotransferase n=1 Tax=Laceyella putida TaxID=110101 RepID=A0ABW2RJ47_9BACL
MILYDNRLISREEAHIDVEDRAYQFGDGVYEMIRVYHGRSFYMDEHLARLERSAREIRLELPYPIAELKQLLHELIRRNQLEEGNIYIQVSRGTAPRYHGFPDQARPLTIAYVQHAKRPLAELNHGIRAITTDDIRWLRCDIKSLNLLGAVLAKQTAIDHGAKEAILIRDGVVTEGSSTNIFIIKDGTLYTHPTNHLILNGITRQVVLKLADECEIPFSETAFSKEELDQADEVFLSSTTMEICPIVEIDNKPVNQGVPGPITKQLQEAFVNEIKRTTLSDTPS